MYGHKRGGTILSKPVKVLTMRNDISCKIN